jgi:hypothetical protein
MPINLSFISAGCWAGARQQDERAFAAPTWPLEFISRRERHIVLVQRDQRLVTVGRQRVKMQG